MGWGRLRAPPRAPFPGPGRIQAGWEWSCGRGREGANLGATWPPVHQSCLEIPVIREAALQQQRSRSDSGLPLEGDICLLHEEWVVKEIRAHWGGKGGKEGGREGEGRHFVLLSWELVSCKFLQHNMKNCICDFASLCLCSHIQTHIGP